MKFTLNNDLQTSPLMRQLLSGLQIFILLFLLLDIFYKSEQLGFSYASVSIQLFGSEEEFIDPLPLATLVESMHVDTFFAMMVLLTLSAVYGRLCRSERRKVVLINIVMTAALLAVTSLVAALYLTPLFIWVWIGTFWIWHLGAAVMSIESLWRVAKQ